MSVCNALFANIVWSFVCCMCAQRYPFVVVYNEAKWNLEKRFSDFSELDTAMEDEFKNDEDVTVR